MTAASYAPHWPFWTGWGLAFVGFPLGGLAATALVGGVENVGDAIIGGAATGLVIGGVQWFVLRRRIALSPLWAVATSAGMATGLAVGVAMTGIATTDNTLLIRGALTGLGIGTGRWLLLRRAVPQAIVWIPTITTGWALGWFITRAAGVDLQPNWSVFGSTGAWGFQLMTGLVLAWLLKQARHE